MLDGMLDRLKSFFGGLPQRPRQRGSGPEGRHDGPHVAAAALMLSVIEADGLHEEEERTRLRTALAAAYGLSGEALDDVVRAGEAAFREAVDLSVLTDTLARDLDDAAKADFVGILWEIVHADGELHELEDNTVWRIAELIGVSQHERVMQRRQVREKHGLPEAGWDD
jgi:uncharacterized tellurite resistance protein B-like protein